MQEISKHYRCYVITADTFGTVKQELSLFDIEVIIIGSDNHTAEKARFIKSLGSDKTVALGNGNNDIEMLKEAILSIAIVGAEGCATATMISSDIVITSISNAMKLLLDKKRLIATLRR